MQEPSTEMDGSFIDSIRTVSIFIENRTKEYFSKSKCYYEKAYRQNPGPMTLYEEKRTKLDLSKNELIITKPRSSGTFCVLLLFYGISYGPSGQFRT